MALGSGQYFKTIPTLPYDTFDGSGEYKVVVDVFKRVRATLQARTDATLYYDYTIKDKETPEIISYKYYGASKYHWVILLMNQIRDPQWDWPLDERSLNKFIAAKYGSLSAAQLETSHYETNELKAPATDANFIKDEIIIPSGIVVSHNFDYSYSGNSWSNTEAVSAVTMHNMELYRNEKKRSIVLLRRNLLYEFIEEFENLILDKR